MRRNLWTIIVVLFLATGCHRDRALVPDELVGSWTTDDPVYRGRSLKLEKEYVLVGFGEDVNPTVQRITKVEIIRNATTNSTTIYSTDKDRQGRTASTDGIF